MRGLMYSDIRGSFCSYCCAVLCWRTLNDYGPLVFKSGNSSLSFQQVQTTSSWAAWQQQHRVQRERLPTWQNWPWKPPRSLSEGRIMEALNVQWRYSMILNRQNLSRGLIGPLRKQGLPSPALGWRGFPGLCFQAAEPWVTISWAICSRGGVPHLPQAQFGLGKKARCWQSPFSLIQQWN